MTTTHTHPPAHVQHVAPAKPAKPTMVGSKSLTSRQRAALATTHRNAAHVASPQGGYWFTFNGLDGTGTIHTPQDTDPTQTLIDNGQDVTRYTVDIAKQTCSCPQCRSCGRCKHLIALMSFPAARAVYFYLTGALWGTVPEEFDPSDVRGVCPLCAGLLFSCLDYVKDAEGKGRGYVTSRQCIEPGCGWVQVI
jgi:hypothetical protein